MEKILKPRNQLLVAGFVLIIALVSITAYAVITRQVVFPNGGTLFTASPGLRVCIDAAATTNVTSIQWGTFHTGTIVTKTAYVKNTGNVNQTVNIATGNPVPSNLFTHPYIKFTTNMVNVNLVPDQIYALSMTLNCTSTPVGTTNFSFDVHVNGVYNEV
jgi:hypothetical protein